MNRFNLRSKTVLIVLTLLTIFGTSLMAQNYSILERKFIKGEREFEFVYVARVLKFLKDQRHLLREKNLVDLYGQSDSPRVANCDANARRFRTADGTCNSLEKPWMGSAGVRFGRNLHQTDLDKGIGMGETGERLLTPSPREVSARLLARNGNFKPIGALNLLAASWIQFMNHDWFNHVETRQNAQITLEPTRFDTKNPNPFSIFYSIPDNAQSPNKPAAYVNENTHWWDGSQIYGSNETTLRQLRSGQKGEMLVSGEGNGARIPVDRATGVELTGFARNWWLGLSLMHQLFVLNHNKIANKLYHLHDCPAVSAASFPAKAINKARRTFDNCETKSEAWKRQWNDERLFQTARLINSAIMAKIHTVEWTPAILNNPALYAGMHVNWTGHTGHTNKVGGWSGLDFFGKLVGGRTNFYNVPYSLTEEFVSVYRLHSLLPEKLQLRVLGRPDEVISEVGVNETREEHSHKFTSTPHKLSDLFFSFSKMNPGRLTLRNFPDFMRNLEIPMIGGIAGIPNMDLGAVDIFRDRERGVPRYNAFRRAIRLAPIRTFNDLTDDKELAAEMESVYKGNVEDVDLLVGTLAEDDVRRPPGFGFGDTMFRIFLLMASRRLEADRFYTADWKPEVYTAEGLKWIDEATMSTVLSENVPELAPLLKDVKNAFMPWDAAHQPK